MQKITFLVLHLNYGGIESFVTTLANLLINNYDVEIVSNYKTKDNIPYVLDEKIKITYLTNTVSNRKEIHDALKTKKIITFFKEVIKAFKILKDKKKKTISFLKQLDTDYLITTRSYHNNLVCKYAKKNIVKIATDHNHHNNNQKYIKELISSIKEFDYFVTVSKALENDYKPLLENTKIKCQTIYTAVKTNFSKANLDTKNITWIGRLAKEKDPLSLIEVFYQVHQKHQDAILNIIGDGEEKQLIIEKIKEYNLEKNIFLHGFQNKEYIDNFLDKTSIYLNTSLTESFGIVICEAFSHGIPALSFKKAIGTSEIIDDGINGYILETKKDMADKVCELLENKELRKILGTKAYEKANKEFSYDTMKNKWLNLLKGDSDA